MAITVASDVGSLINAEAIDTVITEYQYDEMVVAPFVRFKSLVGEGTAVASFPRRVKSPTSIGTIANETTSMTTQAMSFTDTTVSVTRYGILRGISTTAEEDNILGASIYSQEFIMDAARLYGELQDTLVCNLFTGLTASVGSTGTALTLATLAAAFANQRVQKARGRHVCILHDLQAKQLQAAQLAATATAWSQFWDANADSSTNYLGTFFRTDVWSTGLAPTANAAADRVGVLMPVGSNAGGNDAYSPFALVVKRLPTSKSDEDIAQDSKTWASTWRGGVGEIADNFGTKIISQNS
ncbi:MAG: hypothetical protein E6Q97_38505 [Desulfurellales bacterium]|nr:MAG: hypothetical protein E6Q97_38505 [Desulfurellales bacterium]